MAPARVSDRGVRVALLVSVLLLAACTSEFEREFRAAETLRVEAASKGAEWIETGRILDEARMADAEGETARALALVDKARFQSEAALRQADHESKAWQNRVIK